MLPAVIQECFSVNSERRRVKGKNEANKHRR